MEDISHHNHRIHSGFLAPWEYRRAAGLHPAESEILARLRSTYMNKRILDVGVGGGRTTPFLTDISKEYVGIDYSPQMIERSRKRHPDVDLRVCDVRDLSQFRDGEFDLIFFSFNGIDYIDHSDRITALNEIRRVLSDEGTFAFSSHNRASTARSAWSLKHLPYRTNPLRNPKTFMFKLISYLMGIFNYRYLRKHEVTADTYELRNDEASRYSLLTYYIYIQDQIEQLKSAKFRDCQAVDLQGRWLSPAEYSTVIDPWIYYVCSRWPLA
jgi:ubiquinone/menaquinone biosynthesis C-methylase UbiE